MIIQRLSDILHKKNNNLVSSWLALYNIQKAGYKVYMFTKYVVLFFSCY